MDIILILTGLILMMPMFIMFLELMVLEIQHHNDVNSLFANYIMTIMITFVIGIILFFIGID